MPGLQLCLVPNVQRAKQQMQHYAALGSSCTVNAVFYTGYDSVCESLCMRGVICTTAQQIVHFGRQAGDITEFAVSEPTCHFIIHCLS